MRIIHDAKTTISMANKGLLYAVNIVNDEGRRCIRRTTVSIGRRKRMDYVWDPWPAVMIEIHGLMNFKKCSVRIGGTI